MAKTKVQFTIEEELLQELDDYCVKNYTNRSNVICQSVLQTIIQKKMVDSIMNVSLALKKVSESGTLDPEAERMMKEFEVLSNMFLGR